MAQTVEVGAKDGKRGLWQKKYFLETRLGLWTSAECYQAKGNPFQAKGYEARAADIAALRKFDLASWYKFIEDQILLHCRILKEVHKDPNAYFSLVPGSDSRFPYRVGPEYWDEFKKQAERDRQLLESHDGFENRYVMQYDCFPMPQSESRDVLVSFCESLLIAANSTEGTESLIAQSLIRAFRRCGETLQGLTASNLLSKINHRWKDIETEIRSFYDS